MWKTLRDKLEVLIQTMYHLHFSNNSNDNVNPYCSIDPHKNLSLSNIFSLQKKYNKKDVRYDKNKNIDKISTTLPDVGNIVHLIRNT